MADDLNRETPDERTLTPGITEDAPVAEAAGKVEPSKPASGFPAADRTLFFKIFPSLVLPMFLGVVDQTIVATALPAIAGDLGDVERISWIVTSYLIANTIAAPVYGQLGDALGRKRMMFAALGIMVGASILCAFSTSLTMLVIARVLQGLGGGGLMTLSQAMIGEAVPPRERARYQGYLAAVVVTSNAFGPVAGGYLTQAFGWRSVFLINIPLGALALFVARRLPQRPPKGEGWRFDYLGLTYFIAFVFPALFAFEQLQRPSMAVVPYFSLFATIAVVALVLLLRRETRTDFPLIPLGLLRRTAIWRSDALAACHGAALVSIITFVPVYLRVVRGTSASETGLLLLPIAIGIGAGSLITGRLVSRTGRTMIFPSLALLPVLALLLMMAFTLGSLSLGAIALILGFLALFMGSVMGVVNVTVQNAAGPANLGAAAGSVQFSRAVGATFGTALVSALLFSALVSRDPAAADYFSALIEQGPAALAALPPATQAAIQAALGETFRDVFLLIGFYVMLALAMAWSNPERRFG